MTELSLLSEKLTGLQRGFFVAFEGIDGSGKSTQIELLKSRLSAPVLYTREPGGTKIGEELRRLVMHGPHDVDAKTEALLYAADRASHVSSKIEPALAGGTSVVTDRFMDSSVAYQGLGRDLGAKAVKELSMWATGGLEPDLVIILDISPELSSARTGPGRDRIENAGAEFRGTVRDYYLECAEADPARYCVLDGSNSAEIVFDQVVSAFVHALEGKTST
jgi:thymidylate kinase